MQKKRNLDTYRAPELVLISGAYWPAFPGTLEHCFCKEVLLERWIADLELIISSVQICQHLYQILQES